MLPPFVSFNNAPSFVGREKEIEQLRCAYQARRHVLIVALAGIGKSALLRQARRHVPFLVCEQGSSLGSICENLERQLGWARRKASLIERKNRLFTYLGRCGQVLALDDVAMTPPRVAWFIARLTERIPVWITCRSSNRKQIGALWEHLYQFERIELGPLSRKETAALLQSTTKASQFPEFSQNDISQLHRISKGNPRILEELLIELASREYRLNNSFSRNLLDLDRRIHNMTTLSTEYLPGNG